MTTSLPDQASCPGCFKRVAVADATTCAACGAAVWADGRLLLVAPVEEGRASMFRGLLRGDGDGSASGLEEVVVKVLDVGGLPDWRDYERFRRQSDILASLSHPRIPRARGDFEVGSRVLHCQTLVPGRSLARQLRGARLAPDEVTRLADELLELLDYLHGRDVVHRDIKPDNVVIAADGGAHLVDFGAARRLHVADKVDPEPTVVGTPGYMAPEQARGELVAQSDLYALGRLLTEALAGATPERPLAALLPLLCKEDWRKRPASAAAALKLLRPRIGGDRGWWPVVAVTAVALVAVVGIARMGSKGKPAAPAAGGAAMSADPAAPPLTALASALLYEWALAQHARDMDRYARCYAPDFKGIRRTPGGKVLNLDRAAWIADRARIYAQPVDIQTADVQVDVDDTTGTAVITLLQRFRRGNYAEHGHKRFTAKRVGTAMQFTSEEMLDSKRGWDEDEYASQVPMQASTCKVAFDPSNRKHLVVLSGGHDDYAEALRAAAKARKAKQPAEIVDGEAFAALGPGYWVLAGALDDEDKANALAARAGGEVKDGTLAPQPDRGVTRLLARRTLPDMYDFVSSARMFTVVGSTAYAVMRSGLATYALNDPELPSIRKLALPTGAKLVRIVAHKGAAYLLDTEGHWYKVGEQIERVASFDPDDDVGKVAAFRSARFALNNDDAIVLAGRGDSLSPTVWPLAARERALYAVGDDRLAVFRDGELFLFAVGQPKPRLTKLCITFTPPAGDRIKGAAGVAVGGMHLVTDRSGKLDVWTSAWGFLQPELSNLSDANRVLDCGDDEDLSLQMGVVPLFGQISVSADAEASCEAVGC